MANLKSSEKDIRRTATRTVRNRARLSELESALKAVRSAPDGAAARTAYTRATSLLDRASAKDLIHKRTASRQKSRLALFIAKKFPAAKK
jgi:small subunit ribosomal protein S20